MLTITPLFFEQLVKTFNIIDKNDLRPSLKYIEIELIDDNKVILRATNGFTAYKRTYNEESLVQLAKNIGSKWYINIGQLPILKIIAKSKYDVDITYNSSTSKIETNISAFEIKTGINYPDIEKAIKLLGEKIIPYIKEQYSYS